jgi:hypothetical protein
MKELIHHYVAKDKGERERGYHMKIDRRETHGVDQPTPHIVQPLYSPQKQCQICDDEAQKSDNPPWQPQRYEGLTFWNFAAIDYQARQVRWVIKAHKNRQITGLETDGHHVMGNW